MPNTAQKKTPVLFVGHGSPMNAIEDNVWSRGFRSLAGLLPPVKSILAISAHWYLPGTLVTAQTKPKTIHDFGGFPEELYQIRYPAPGDPSLAKCVADLLSAERARTVEDWGIDHGTWSVLRHVFPDADIPVVQLSVDARATAKVHLQIGRKLAALRDEGVLIIASGNITHNLHHAPSNYSRGVADTPAWASDFDAAAAENIEQKDGDALARLLDSETGRLSHPSPDHYLPLLYAVGAAVPADSVSFPIKGFDLGSLSMRSVILGS